MTQLNCFAVDDEPLALDLISENIKRVEFLNLAGTSSSPKKALDFLKSNKVDLLFLDIQMPGLLGVDLAKQLSPDTMVVFTTAYDNYAIDGYNLNAVDYLLKPIDFQRFLRACEKAKDLFEWKMNKEKTKFILVHSEHTLIKVQTEDLIYVEGLKDYVKLFVRDQSKPILTRMNLKGIEAILPVEDFVRIHKSYIINRKKITKLNSKLILLNDIEIPIGDTYKSVAKELVHG